MTDERRGGGRPLPSAAMQEVELLRRRVRELEEQLEAQRDLLLAETPASVVRNVHKRRLMQGRRRKELVYSSPAAPVAHNFDLGPALDPALVSMRQTSRSERTARSRARFEGESDITEGSRGESV